MAQKYCRGQVWWWSNPHTSTEENTQHLILKDRPVLIVSNDSQNENARILSVCPLTTKDRYDDYYTICTKNGAASVVLAQQLTTVNCWELQNYMFTLSDKEMKAVDQELCKLLGLFMQLNNIDAVKEAIDTYVDNQRHVNDAKIDEYVIDLATKLETILSGSKPEEKPVESKSDQHPPYYNTLQDIQAYVQNQRTTDGSVTSLGGSRHHRSQRRNMGRVGFQVLSKYVSICG